MSIPNEPKSDSLGLLAINPFIKKYIFLILKYAKIIDPKCTRS